MNHKILMTTEGTYPFHHGGVSIWCDSIIKDLAGDFDFFVYSIIMNPFVTQKFTLPRGSTLIKVPLWGTEEPGEFLDIPFSRVYLTKKRTTDAVIRSKFLPLLTEMVRELITPDKNPGLFGQILNELYLYFQQYDYKDSFKSELAWKTYKSYVMEISSGQNRVIPSPGILSVINSMSWLYRFMVVLNVPLPRVDVTHSSAAAFCGIPCVLEKLQNNTPYLLTEHGLYLREQYLSLTKRGYSSFMNTFFIRMIHSIVGLSYHYADQVSPVCAYNTRWERRFGVEERRINVIYNGVDQSVFIPDKNPAGNKYPTVVAVARIDPVKDIITLIKTAALVKEKIPDVRFVVYGSVTVKKYYEECLALTKELSLQQNFIFAGHTSDVNKVYSSGDIVALSSVSEGFPYSIIEAMMSARPVIATDVGGVNEVIGDCGVLVPPRNPESFAKEVVNLLNNPQLRAELSEEGRERALTYFTLNRINTLYVNSYRSLITKPEKVARTGTEDAAYAESGRKNQKLFVEKGLLLMNLSMYREAIGQFRLAVGQQPESPAVPALVSYIADCYAMLGEHEQARNEREKAEALDRLYFADKRA
jgi:Glycosyltransferase